MYCHTVASVPVLLYADGDAVHAKRFHDRHLVQDEEEHKGSLKQPQEVTRKAEPTSALAATNARSALFPAFGLLHHISVLISSRSELMTCNS